MPSGVQVLPLDEFVFNTEAHPLPLPGSPRDRQLQRSYLRGPDNLDLRQMNYSAEALQQASHHYRDLLPAELTAI
jgi:hypothetical protein